MDLHTVEFMMLNQLPTADEIQEEQNVLYSVLAVVKIKDWSCSSVTAPKQSLVI